MRIIIGGDFCVTPEFLSNTFFNDDIIQLFNASDFNLLNLECPIVEHDKGKKILKTGPHLKTGEEIFQHLSSINIHAVTLANNHILDFGVEGLKNTIERCRNRNILYVGAGLSIHEIEQPLIIEREGTRIGVINFCENEWSTLSSLNCGANSMDIIDNVKQIKKLREIVDLIIVIIHGGHEYYHLPSTRMVKQYRFYAENGADIIVGHHSHCIGGYEVHQGKPIIFSLGNFLFTSDSNFDQWYTGLLLSLVLENNKLVHWELIPISQQRDSFSLHLLKGNQRQSILDTIENLKEIISDKESLAQEWEKYVLKNMDSYLQTFSPSNILGNRIINSLLRSLRLTRLFINPRQYKQILNRLRCESHYDLSKSIIEKYLIHDK
ncbi:MAG: CapA family protein [Bacteroidales bacterium]|nr:CapA family protein [Bacteroidales bacterium]